MRGEGSGAIFEALPMPLGSTVALFIPPAFAGPGGIPLMGTFPVPASPATRANEAAGTARKMKNARAIKGNLCRDVGHDEAPLSYESA